MANKQFQNVLKAVPQKVPPIWLMRQAGRYQASYRSLREKHSFEDLCKQPELASQVALSAVREFDFDVAILFSDILFILEAMGIGLKYDPGPQLAFALTTDTISQLKEKDEALAHLDFQCQAMRATRELLPADKSLVGFVGGPWTLFGYAAEGGHSGSMLASKRQPGLAEEFFNRLMPLLIANIDAQLKSGAELVYVFDTAAGELAYEDFVRYFERCLRPLMKVFPGKLAYFAKHMSEEALAMLGDSRWTMAGLVFDQRWSMERLLRESPFSGFHQGNFDPCWLHLNEDDFKEQLSTFIDAVKSLPLAKRSRWLCSLGHGVLPETPEDHVKYFVDSLREAFA